MIWLVLAAFMVVALAIVLPPLLQTPRPASTGGSELAVYRDQLREIDSDLERGLISAAEADAARIEIKRRMLAVPKADGVVQTPPRHATVAVALAVGLGLFSGSLYLTLGRPSLPGRAFDPVAAQKVEEQNADKAMLAQIEGMVAKLADKLKANPNDAMGWRMLGWSYVELGRVDEGVAALARAVLLDPKNAALRSQYGEALVRAGDGKITPAATKAFDDALALDAKDPRARFYRGMALLQAGKEKDALALWVEIIRDGPADAAWMPGLREQARLLAAKLKVDPKTVP